MTGMSMLAATVNVPLVGHADNDPYTAHRVTLAGLPLATWGTASHATAVCGVPVKLTATRWDHLRTRGTPLRRCTGCQSPETPPPAGPAGRSRCSPRSDGDD